MSATEAGWTARLNEMLRAIDEEPVIYLMVRRHLWVPGMKADQSAQGAIQARLRLLAPRWVTISALVTDQRH
jgi:hypothetical protein